MAGAEQLRYLPAALLRLRHLRSLDVRGCGLGAEPLLQLLEDEELGGGGDDAAAPWLPSLDALRLDGCVRLGDSTAAELAALLSPSSGGSSAGVRGACGARPAAALRTLTLAGCMSLSDAGLEPLLVAVARRARAAAAAPDACARAPAGLLLDVSDCGRCGGGLLRGLQALGVAPLHGGEGAAELPQGGAAADTRCCVRALFARGLPRLTGDKLTALATCGVLCGCEALALGDCEALQGAQAEEALQRLLAAVGPSLRTLDLDGCAVSDMTAQACEPSHASVARRGGG